MRSECTKAVAVVCALALGGVARAQAQVLPSTPIVTAGGRLAVSGDASGSVGGEDLGFFNYTDYEHSALRLFRVSVTASFKAGDHLSALGELLSENVGSPRVYGLYLRIRPWTTRRFDVQVGRVPPTFGAFSRRTYAADNPLIGFPLAYQYLVPLRTDAVPASADELLRMRGIGWRPMFSIGNQAIGRGLPIASIFSWDTGVQAHVATDVLEATAAVTNGTLSNPLFTDDNGGKQVAGRLVVHPTPGLLLGASAARGAFLSDAASRSAVGDGHDGDFTQTAWGADLEYSRSYYLLRFEGIVSDWTVPAVRAPFIGGPLRAIGTSVEGRYKIMPGLYVAARVDHLGFNDVTGTATRASWDAPVTRFEIGGGYALQRNLVLKLAYQHDTRDAGRVHQLNAPAAQLVYWF